jgi:hypothetical protein
MTFKLAHTTISETRVSMRYVNNEDPQEWVDFQVNVPPAAANDRQSLGMVQRLAIERARDVLNMEQQSRAGLQRT